ncbi:uncharacterized protein EI90DRAFT_3280670 [Cantharellus anzutake]|uniref:uncharacterized protein n=1 Tax=Cantharellus anzutake TaxID=1750568 RepID=UPI0019070CBB|nr:uncharacterized protein EI90DRAFT_3280670 [Cantharellus anzutake]KAF8332411.1 hypothetical protein EI90DRAFT_3280670 [Cantharellus anzutake]
MEKPWKYPLLVVVVVVVALLVPPAMLLLSLSTLPRINVDEADVNTPDKWIRRHPSMVRHTGKHPFNSEAPFDKLFAAGFLTPTSLFYVRNHGAVPYVDADRAANWRLRIHGLVEREVEFSIDDLKEKFQVVTLPVTLACAGNRRKEQNVVQKTLGFNWGPAVLSTALFTGVYLADVLKYVRPFRPMTNKHVIFEGADTDLPNGPYGTSQTLREASDIEKGIMIVWGMNGKALSPDHGFPLRTITPGRVGGRSVKWLTSIEVSDTESQHHLHFFDNRVLPTQVTAQQARDEKHWWYNKNSLLNDLNVNSAIAHPSHGEIVQLSKLLSLQTVASYDIRGYAYSGGGRRVTRVEISLDQGSSWKISDIVYPEDLYRMVAFESKFYGTLDLTERETSFCWCFWKYTASIEELSKSDAIIVRAMDEGLGIQPQDMYWTASGLMNNWWFRIAIHHEVKDDVDILRFEHPTLPGVTPGGWMERIKNAGLNPLRPEFGAPKQGNNHDAVSRRPLQEKCEPASMTDPEVNREKALFVVDGNVYDGTNFLEEHPGGADSIWLASGEADATEDFIAIHSDDARTKLKKFHIGRLQANEAESQGDDTTDAPPDDDPSASVVFLDRRKWKAARLVGVTGVSHDSFIYRFALESPEQPLGLPVGQHVFVRLRRKTTGEMVQRAYTPVSQQDEHGHIDLLIKLYLPCVAFPLGGKMTVGFHELLVGDTVEFKGPLGSFVWEGKGNVRWKDVPRSGIRHLGLICGGSGITPILQVLRSVLHDEDDSETRLYLLDANKTESDILCREELDTLYEQHGDKKAQTSGYAAAAGGGQVLLQRLKIHHTLSRPPPEWAFSTGRIDDGMLEALMPPPADDAMVLVCGPDGMINDAVKPGLERLGWDVSKALVVF